MSLKPEKLKVIAEGMGYQASNFYWPSYSGKIKYITVKGKEYNPLTNAEQCMEIMEEVKITLLYDFVLNYWSASKVKGSKRIIGEGKTINEAVCNAAFEYFK